MKRRTWWLVIGVGIPLLLVLVAVLIIDPLTERALRRVAADMETNGYRVDFTDIKVSILTGHLRLLGTLIQPTDSLLALDSLPHFRLEADEVDLRGVDLKALLLNGVLRVGRLSISSPRLDHSRITGSVTDAREKEEEEPAVDVQEALARIHIDTILVDGATARSTDRNDPERNMAMERMDLRMIGLRFLELPGGALRPVHESADMDIHGITMGVAPFHTLFIDQVELDAQRGWMRNTGIAYIPEHGPGDYHMHVDHQIELASFTADTILVKGFDLAANIRYGALFAGALEVHGLVFRSYRDKSIPEDPDLRKPLPAEALRSIAFPVSVDSIFFDRVNVHYNERIKREDDYGTISFTSINGTLTGLSNLRTSTSPDLHLQGTAQLYERGSMMMDLRMPMAHDEDMLTVKATLKNLPFELLNHMTDNLVSVNATEGRIHMVAVDFTGNDRQARGNVEVRYEDLRLQLSPSMDHSRALSFLANTIVRRTNMPEDRRYRKGSFSVERAMDKSVFNYLWRGAREGMLEVMLPPMVLNRVKKTMEEGPSS